MRAPLYLDATNRDGTVTLARCLNCGKIKALSDPCSFDHLQALIDLGADLRANGVRLEPTC